VPTEHPRLRARRGRREKCLEALSACAWGTGLGWAGLGWAGLGWAGRGWITGPGQRARQGKGRQGRGNLSDQAGKKEVGHPTSSCSMKAERRPATKRTEKQATASIIFRGSTVTFALDEKCTFGEFDTWLRSRFGLSATVGLRYDSGDQGKS